jgi:hypothetical protein
MPGVKSLITASTAAMLALALAACDNYDEDGATSAVGCSDPFHNN